MKNQGNENQGNENQRKTEENKRKQKHKNCLTCLRMQKLISLLALVLPSCRCCLMAIQCNAPATSLCDVSLNAACVDVLKLRLEQEKQQQTQHNKKIYKNMTNRASLEAPPAISSRVSSYKKLRESHAINQVFFVHVTRVQRAP